MTKLPKIALGAWAWGNVSEADLQSWIDGLK